MAQRKGGYHSTDGGDQILLCELDDVRLTLLVLPDRYEGRGCCAGVIAGQLRTRVGGLLDQIVPDRYVEIVWLLVPVHMSARLLHHPGHGLELGALGFKVLQWEVAGCRNERFCSSVVEELKGHGMRLVVWEEDRRQAVE